jgi:tetratricopeptide (TPR) repeat protein
MIRSGFRAGVRSGQSKATQDELPRRLRSSSEPGPTFSGSSVPIIRTIRTRLGLASNLHRSGDFPAAVSEYEQALAAAERLDGADQRLAVVAADRLADAHLKAGQPAKAAAVLESAIARANQGHGVDVKSDALRRVRLGSAYAQAGDAAAGVTVVEAVVADLGHELGTGDALILDTQFVLADLYLKAGRKQESGELYSQVLPDLTRLYGPDHQVTKLARARRARPRGIRLGR